MPDIIPPKLKNLWDEWNLRSSILFSLFLQILLISFAPSRKRRGTTFITLIIWSSYLLADWVAAFAVGLISNSISNKTNKYETPVQTEDVLAFWAPFLLLHLGGPDAITAFSLEDNELWIRHLFSLLIQLVAVGYVIIQSLPSDLWIPTTLMLLVGIIKYAERTRALYLGCLGNFKANMLPDADAGPNYSQLMEENSSKKIAHVPAEIKIEKEIGRGDAADYDVQVQSLSELEVVEGGFRYFKIFKGLIVDLMFTFNDRKESRKYFFARTTEDAFKVLEVELNFMYDALYTKMVVVNGKIGYILRFVCTACLVVALERFAAHHKHTNGGDHRPDRLKMHVFDVYVTYALLIGAIGLDSIAIIKLIFSDWTIVRLKYPKAKNFIFQTRKTLTFWRIGKWSKAFGRRWSNKMSQHSLVRFCLKERFKWINKVADSFGLVEILDEIQYKTSNVVGDDLKFFIFELLKEKARKAEDSKTAREICAARGDWVLLHSACHSLTEFVDVEYDESLLLWHVATDLCFYEMDDKDQDPEVGSQPSDEKTKNNRTFSKYLSDYMLYLLVMRPTMMSAVAGIGQIRFQDTCEEAKKFFRRKDIIPGGRFKENSLLSWFKKFFISPRGRSEWKCSMSWFKTWLHKFYSKTRKRSEMEKIKRACAELLLIETVVKPVEVKGDRSKSVLFDACILAKELKGMDERKRWKVMSEVWVELLSYAATHCRANTHAQQFSKGGELVSFVWLLMTQLGLGDQFRVEAGHARAKLLVQK